MNGGSEGKIICLHPTIVDVVKKSDMLNFMHKGLAQEAKHPNIQGRTGMLYKGIYYELAPDLQHYHRVKEEV